MQSEKARILLAGRASGGYNLSMNGDTNRSVPMSEVGRKRIGANLRALRTARGLSAKSLASAAGISRTAVYAIEYGNGTGIGTLEALAGALGCELADLVARR